VTVVGEETLALDGRSWHAWKVEPRIRHSVERRDPPAITAWIATDSQRVPLVIEVAADFGSVRAELASSRAR